MNLKKLKATCLAAAFLGALGLAVSPVKAEPATN